MPLLPFNAGQAYWNQRQPLSDIKERLLVFYRLVNRPVDLALPQYFQLFAMIKEFEPALIIELGRGYGNSTCVLTEAANRLKDTKVVSFCRSDDWPNRISKRVAQFVDKKWFSKLEVHVTDITEVDFASIVKDKKKIFLLWDAHGWELAEYVLGAILPQLKDKDHLVVVHDITDVKYHPYLKSYNGLPLWKGYPGDDKLISSVILDRMSCPFEEGVGLFDFSCRNNLTLHSVEEEIRTYVEEGLDKRLEMERLVGRETYSPISYFFWFSLNELTNQDIFFPKASKQMLDKESLLANRLVHDLKRFAKNGQPSFKTFLLILAKIFLKRYKLKN